METKYGIVSDIHGVDPMQVAVIIEALKQKGATKLGITMAVSGHFHESAHRAHDADGNPVKQGTFTRNLFWAASYVDAMKAGILTVKDGVVAYENIDASTHIR